MSVYSSVFTRLTVEQRVKVDRMVNQLPRLTLTEMADALAADGISI